MDTSTSSIPITEMQTKMKLFPNIINEQLNIQFSYDKTYLMSIFIAKGVKIYVAEAKENFQLATSNFTAGMYIVQLQSNNKTYSLKFFK